ncbi:alpha-L-fucosidase [Pontiella sp.]|uniref:alpha-L-fucosidase n=1 Tax=Pontiella sp. TaxID=2837462 RepID=UPI003569B80D
MKTTNRLIIAAICSCWTIGVAANPQRGNPDYAATAAPSGPQVFAPLPINPEGINVVAGILGNDRAEFKNNFRNYMNLWMEPKAAGPCHIEWKLNAPADGIYDVCAVAAGNGSRMKLACNGALLEAAVEGKGWDRIALGTIPLKAGENMLTLEVEAAKGFQFDTLELVRPAVKAALLSEAQASRKSPDWFKDAGYGLMFQWTNRATPPAGSIKPWEQKVDDFDLEGFVEMVEESGAAYVLWSITWGNQYISAPIKSLDAILPGRTTQRDLLGEMADALHARGIKLIFYYHYGYDCNHSIDADWMEATGGYRADKSELFKNWSAIVSEIGNRYGDKLNGWWFDGGQRYYNCHFDGTPGDQGILSAPFKELTLAAKSGNPERVVAYNSWVKPRLTEYQDFYGGEGKTGFQELRDGVFPSGQQEGLMAHGCFILERKWGHIEKNAIIAKPKYSLKKLTEMVRTAQQKRYPLSINLEMYEDGSVSPASRALLKQLREATREH